MRPPKRSNNFEKVQIGEMLSGIIEEVQYDTEHKFKGFQGKEDTVGTAIRFKFKLDGYAYPHYSRWMKLTLAEKSNLYKKYASRLIEGCKPDADIDLDILNKMRVKTVWSEENDWQNLDTIYPEGQKVKPTDVPVIQLNDAPPVAEPADEVEEDDGVPF